MSSLFIANCTKQHHDFIYLPPESIKQVLRQIPIGGQIEIKGESRLFDAIVAQHQPYGLVEARKLTSGKAFNGLAYQIDKALNVDAIAAGISHNDEALNERGTDARKAALLASSNILGQEAQENGGALNNLEVDVIEQRMGPTDNADQKNKQTMAIGQPDEQPQGRRGKKR